MSSVAQDQNTSATRIDDMNMELHTPPHHIVQQYKFKVYRGNAVETAHAAPMEMKTSKTSETTNEEFLHWNYEYFESNKYIQEMQKLAQQLHSPVKSVSFAQQMDQTDKLSSFRSQFHIPLLQSTGQPVLYFCGNSLGLQPKTLQSYVNEELEKWKSVGVMGHFQGKRPWFNIEDYVTKEMAQVVGAKPNEVVVMNTLTTNLHLLMVAFYKPTQKKFKILIEEFPFPSDMHAIVSQVRYHGYSPEEAIIQVGPRKGEHFIRTEDILQTIEKEADQLHLVLLSSVHFMSGQFFDMKKIAEVAHANHCYIGFDCAHGAGNVPLQLHDNQIDFACWCTYKYLNSGPGNIAGLFVHEKHGNASFEELPRFCGWWGHKRDTRFTLTNQFDPQFGAASFQLSNPCVLSVVALQSSLQLFEQATMEVLRQKSLRLTSYLEYCLRHTFVNESQNWVELVTPSDPERRGCQISVRVLVIDRVPLATLMHKLEQLGLICDDRKPDIIRLSPTPLYNSFEDVFRAVQVFHFALRTLQDK